MKISPGSTGIETHNVLRVTRRQRHRGKPFRHPQSLQCSSATPWSSMTSAPMHCLRCMSAKHFSLHRWLAESVAVTRVFRDRFRHPSSRRNRAWNRSDRIGRRPAMLIAFLRMGIGMLGLAVTPSYARIGIVAPILHVLFRLLQGFALGGKVGPSISRSGQGRRSSARFLRRGPSEGKRQRCRRQASDSRADGKEVSRLRGQREFVGAQLLPRCGHE